MVGKYIALLESELGTRLLERNTRRQSLTDAGRVYFDEAKRVLEQVAIAESAVERLRAAPAGTLRVTAPTSFGGCVIAPLTATFLQRYPAVRIELDLTNRMVDLVEEGVDLAIRIGDIRNDDLVRNTCALQHGDLRVAGLSGAPRYAANACRSGGPSLPFPHGMDRAQRMAVAGCGGRSALEARCHFTMQRRLRLTHGGARRGRAASAAGGAGGGRAGKRQAGSGSGAVYTRAEAGAFTVASGFTSPPEANGIYCSYSAKIGTI
ncbi:LysR family transcriptional regulator [Enterobacter cloacae]|uniref:LysR family transcriptional regulator n=1 Tax=Enterobacter cloacae TaxID=550 RepID=A0A377LWT3_ENTCL|nr:LysR family transcriptional regulator [Enterobacter cloacae]